MSATCHTSVSVVPTLLPRLSPGSRIRAPVSALVIRRNSMFSNTL